MALYREISNKYDHWQLPFQEFQARGLQWLSSSASSRNRRGTCALQRRMQTM
jgi:hypothetical protein